MLKNSRIKRKILNYDEDESEESDSPEESHDEGDTDSNSFIDDRSVKDEDEVIELEGDSKDSIAYEDVLASLSRRTAVDVKNTEKFYGEQSKYQLQIHSPRNRALYVDPDKRAMRNFRQAAMDVGLQDPMGIPDKDMSHSSRSDTDTEEET